MKNINFVNKLILILITCVLVACGSAQESKVKYMQQGKDLFKAERYEKALLAFKNVLQIDPKDAEGHYQMAETYSKQGDINKAFGHYRQAMTLDEQHVMAKVKTGQIFLLSRNLKLAEELLQECLTLAPENVDVLIFQAGVNIVKQDTDAAIVIIKQALQQEPDNTSAIMMLASIYAKQGDTDAAIKILKDAEVNTPDNESMHSLLAKIYNQKGLKPEVENELKTLIKINPDSLTHYKYLALFYMGEKQNDQAEKVLRDAVKQITEDESAQFLLIDFLANNKGLDVAINELSTFIAQQPEAYPLNFKLFSLQLQNKNSDAAIATLNKVIELDKLGSAGLKARNLLARYYVTTQKPDQAKELMNVVLAENPRDTEALTLRGQFALSEKRVLDAIADFREVLVGQPDNVKGLKLLATAQIQNKDFELAIENLEKVAALAPKDKATKQQLIELLTKTNNPIKAEQHINELVKIDPTNKIALGNLFKLKLSKKDWDGAQEIANTYQNSEAEADKAKGFYMSGMAYQVEGEFDKSITAFKQTLAIEPQAVEPLTRLVKSYLVQKKDNEAISYLNTLIKVNKDNFIAYNLLGELYLKNKKDAAAEKALRQSISIKPEWHTSHHNLALLLLKNKDKAGATEVLLNGINKTNSALVLINDLGAIYENENKYEEVIQLYEDAYKKYPSSPVVINNLANYLSEYKTSKETLDRAEEISKPLEESNNPNMLDTVAWIAFKQGNYEKAQNFLEQAIEKGSVSPEIHYHLGLVYYKQGDNQSAQTELEKAVQSKYQYKHIEHAKEVLQQIKDNSSAAVL